MDTKIKRLSSYDDRDYNPDDIEVDERFILSKKDMLITFTDQIIYTFLMIFCAYFFSKGDPKDIPYIFGMPGWWFICLLITAINIVIIYILTHKKYKDVDVDAYLKKEVR